MLTKADQLALARDSLRGKESDHFRISQLPEDGGPGRLAVLEDQVVRLREKVNELEAEVEAEEADDDTS